MECAGDSDSSVPVCLCDRLASLERRLGMDDVDPPWIGSGINDPTTCSSWGPAPQHERTGKSPKHPMPDQGDQVHGQL